MIAWLAGCGEPSSPAPGEDVLRLQVAVARSIIDVGETTSATITLQNLSGRAVTIHFSSGCQILPYIAAQPADEIVYPGGGHSVCTAALTQLTLPPRAKQTQTLSLRGSVARGAAGTVITLTPGDYLIHATLASGEFPLRADPVSLTVR